MSGHSKWSTIKHKKGAADKKRAVIFAKLTKAIAVAAHDGGGDPETNYTLRSEIEKAKEFNLPKIKIDSAIKRGTGEDKEGIQFEELLMEGLGPEAAAILISIITDNRNRTTAEIRHLLSDYGWKLAGEGSVKWQFEYFGVFYIQKTFIQNKEEFELLIIEEGAKDILEKKEYIKIYTKIDDINNMLAYLKKCGYSEVETRLEWVPKNKITVSGKTQEKIKKLFDALDENEDVQEIYINID